MTQNLNSVTFQPFVLYTAAAGIYVLAAFAFDFIFRVIEKSLTTPPTGGIADWSRGDANDGSLSSSKSSKHFPGEPECPLADRATQRGRA